MRFNDLFKNRRNIYFVSLIIMALLLAGGVWQYNNYLSARMSELDFENQLDELDKLLEEQNDIGAKIIEDIPAEAGSEEPIKEVANTDADTKKKATPIVPNAPTASNNKEKNGFNNYNL